MRIKLFYSTDFTRIGLDRLEDNINDYLKYKNVHDIKFTSEAAENGHSINILVITK